MRYHFDRFSLLQNNHVIPTGEPIHDDTLIENYPTRIFELGGDVTRPLAAGALKFVGLLSRQSRHTLDEYDVGNFGHTAVVGGFQQVHETVLQYEIGKSQGLVSQHSAIHRNGCTGHV